MFDRSTLRYWIGRFLLGLLMLFAAGSRLAPRLLGIRDVTGVSTLLLGVAGFYLAYSSVRPATRLLGYRAHTRRQWSDAASAAFARASLPRRLFYLLVAVAEADGPMTQQEREVVRLFLLERFPEPVHADEIRLWETQPLPVQDRIGLAARIASSVDEAEADTIFCWCAMVAFADGRFLNDEHRALQEVVRGLGIPPTRARMLFHLARAQFLSQQRRRGAAGGDGPQEARWSTMADSRREALAILGLPIDASREQIRRRHRELVRRFHPDAQPHLGDVAQQEARERFQAIQRAYETLTDGG